MIQNIASFTFLHEISRFFISAIPDLIVIISYQNLIGERKQDYSNEMSRLGMDYDTSKQAWGLPFGLTGMMPSTFSQGITTSPQNQLLGMGGGAAGGAMTGAMFGSAFPSLGTGLGALLGGGAGLFGGMGGK